MSDEQTATENVATLEVGAPVHKQILIALPTPAPWYKRLRPIHYIAVLFVVLALAIVTDRVATPQQHTVSAPIALTPSPISVVTPTATTSAIPTFVPAHSASTSAQAKR